MDTHRVKIGCMHACIFRHESVCIPVCMYVAYFLTLIYLLMNAVSIHQLIERMVEIYAHLYIHLCMHKIPHLFYHCDSIVFRLYVKLLSTHGPNLSYYAIFLNKHVLCLYLLGEGVFPLTM